MKKISIALLGWVAFAITGKVYSQKLYIYDQNTNLPLNQVQVKTCDGQSTLHETGAGGFVTLIQMASCYTLEALS